MTGPGLDADAGTLGRHPAAPRLDVAGARRPGRSETALILDESPRQAEDGRKTRKRVKGGAGVEVAPIGAADTIRGALGREGLRAKATGILQGVSLRGPRHHGSM